MMATIKKELITFKNPNQQHLSWRAETLIVTGREQAHFQRNMGGVRNISQMVPKNGFQLNHNEAIRRILVCMSDVEENNKNIQSAVIGEDDIGDLTTAEM